MRRNIGSLAAPLVVFGVLGAFAGCGSKGENGSPSGTAGATSSSTSGSGGSGGGGSSSHSSTSASSNSTSSSTSTNTSTTSSSASTTSSTTSSTSTSSTSTSSSSSGGGASGWTVVPLIDDTTDPQTTVFRSGNDRVTGIYFKTIDDGWVATSGAQQTFADGGAVFKAKQKEITKVLFSGNVEGGICSLGTLDFYGIDPTPDGVVAFTEACSHVASHDGGQTFLMEASSANHTQGGALTLALREGANFSLLVGETGYVSNTAGRPGTNAVWADTWAPEANPPIPNPVPTNQCQGRPHGWQPTTRSPVYVSPDGKFVAYTASPDFNPQVCISTDGGKTFFPKLLPQVPTDVTDFQPLGVTFVDASTGIVHWGDGVHNGLAYIYRTTDGGQTWHEVYVPLDIVGKAVELNYSFFAPDKVHGWIVGYDYTDSLALLIRTDDAGATWKHESGDLAAKVDHAGGNKLYTGFALDANHIWVGGEYGVLLASDSGGK